MIVLKMSKSGSHNKAFWLPYVPFDFSMCYVCVCLTVLCVVVVPPPPIHPERVEREVDRLNESRKARESRILSAALAGIKARVVLQPLGS